MLFDTPETVLKTQTLNEDQKKEIKSWLSNSRYSKLEYNKAETEISTQEKKRKVPFPELPLDSCDHPVSASLISDDESDSVDYITTNKENDELAEDMYSEMEETKLPLSPSMLYANLNNLSESEQLIVNSEVTKLVENFRLNKTRTVRRQSATNDESLKSRLDSLKKLQKATKASLAKELEAASLKATTALKEALKSTEEAAVLPPKFDLDVVAESDLSKVQGLESQLARLAGQLRQVGLRCEDEEFKHLFDRNFHDSVRASVLCVEKVSESGRTVASMNQIQMQNRLFDLQIIEAKYSLILEEFENKVDAKLDQYAKYKERLEQESLAKQLQREKKEAEIREQKQAKYLMELDKYSLSCQDVAGFLSSLVETNLAKKSAVIASLANAKLKEKAEALATSIRSEISRVETFAEETVKGSRAVHAWDLSDKQLTDFHKELKESMTRFVVAGGEFDRMVKELGKSIEEALGEKEREAKEKLEANRAAEEAKKLNEVAEKAAAAQKLAQEKELAAVKERAAQAKVDTISRVKAVNDDDKNGVHSLTYVEFNKRREAFLRLVSEVEEPFKESTLKMYKFDLQKAVNFPLNSMLEDKSSEDNKRNFNEKIKTLLRLLKGHTCTITSTLTVNPTKHAKAVDFCLVYLARKLVEKGEETVGSRPETAFQYSQLIIDVLRQVPRFEAVILGQMQETCPLIVPYYKPRIPNQSDEQYLSSLGYKTINGKLEEEVHFIKRMSGVLHLYFTLLMTVDSSVGATLGMGTAWQWLADVLNLAPRPNLTAEMLTIFFKCCGYKMQAYYGKQFSKLANVCVREFLELINSIPKEKQSGASIGRLDSVMEQFRKFNRFAEWRNIN